MPASHRLSKASRSLAVAGLALLLAAQSADAAGAVPATRATTSNPYAHCTIGAAPSDSVNYTNAEVEPSVAVNPTNPRNIVGVVQQDRWNDGGAHGIVAMVSKDGGHSFKVVPLPFSSCAPGGLPYERTSDPWISFGPDGTAYAVSIPFDENSWRSAVSAATSTDGGMTWGNVTEVVADTAYFHDKEMVTADPTKPGTAYIVWDRGTNSSLDGTPEPSFISRTTDFGHTWSTPKQITKGGTDFGDIGNLLVIDPHDGTLYDFLYRFHVTPGVYEYVMIRSTDGGNHWSQPTVVAQDFGIWDMDPHPGGGYIRTASDAIPEAAIDPTTGQLYMVWEDARFTGGAVNQVLITSSKDGGRKWSKPTVVSTQTGQAAFTPSVAVDAAGRVAVTYYDFRAYDPAKAPLPTDYWMKISGRRGTAFGGDIALTSKPFDMLKTPNANGWFVGDYESLATNGGTFYALWCGSTGKADNLTDCWLSTVRAGH